MLRWAALGLMASVLAAGCGAEDPNHTAAGSGGTGGTGGIAAGGSGGGAGGSAGSGGVGGEGGVQDPTVQRVEVVPTDFCSTCNQIRIGEARTFQATAFDAEDQPIEGLPVVWSTSDESVGTVSEGVVTGVGVGSLTVRAVMGGIAGEYDMEVRSLRVASIEVTPQVAEVAAGETVQFHAVAKDDNGNVLDVPVIWSVANPRVGSVDGTGLATGTANGTAVVFATVPEETAASAILDVSGGADPDPGFVLTAHAQGGIHGCGLDEMGTAWCWGWNYFGQLGNDTTGAENEYFEVPLEVEGGHTFLDIAAGTNHTCALDEGGGAWCWGLDDMGQIGAFATVGEVGGTVRPYPVLGDRSFARLSLGSSHSCAIEPPAEGEVGGIGTCWGSNADGQAGLGAGETRDAIPTPTEIVGDHRWIELKAGLWNTCGLDEDGAAWCWGSRSVGTIGDGEPANDARVREPVAVAGGHTFVQLDLDTSHACAITAAGEAFCWGRNDEGNVGQEPSWQPQITPAQVPTDLRFVQIATGTWHTCALTEAGEAWCWGQNINGQLGDGTLTSSWTPVRVAGGHHFKELSLSNITSCGRTLSGETFCWGGDDWGEAGLGFGGFGSLSPVPWPVAIPQP